ncbi:MAG: hypothetical protein JRE43_02490 [Deltaproteobacteria bacterium]|jgi:hypothetical protein|nr:hypothetical protein [Deltaproteobacteria bacterium]
MKHLRRALLISLACLGCLPVPAWSDLAQSYEFKVFLGDQEIGRQRFDVSSDGEQTHVRVDAQFEVKFFYITFYEYRHTNSEKWERVCLREIRSQTNDNGDDYSVNGNFENGQLQVQTQTGNWSADGCIKTFAYWNPEWISGDRLLNSQTGELLPVSILSLGVETIPVRGVPTRTTRRQIISSEFTIDLWYAENGRWVGLQSTTKKGDPLRYVLQ